MRLNVDASYDFRNHNLTHPTVISQHVGTVPRVEEYWSRKCMWFFYIFCWQCISLQILANGQLDALCHVFIYFISLHVSSFTVLIIRRSNCINTFAASYL